MIAIVVIEAILLVAMAFAYYRAFRKSSLAERLLGAVIPFSQALVMFFYLLAVQTDAIIGQFDPYVIVAGFFALIFDGLAYPSLRESGSKKAEEARSRAASQLVEACRQGADQARRDAEEAKETRRRMAELIDEVITLGGSVSAAGNLEASALSAKETGVARTAFCENVIVDAVVALKATQAAEKSIAFRAHLVVPEGLAIEDVDLCGMFSNLLDNALRASSEAQGRNRFINLRAKVRGSMLVVSVENGRAKPDGNRGVSRDPRVGGHGWGLDILRSLAGRYGGSFFAEGFGRRWESTLIVSYR